MAANLEVLVRRDGPLDYERAVRYVVDVARQLAACYPPCPEHADVRPGNIVISESGSARLVTLRNRVTPFFSGSESRCLTEAGEPAALEFADYLPPERALNGKRIDGRADVYSLGCLLYFMLTGRPPFAEGSISARLLAHQSRKPEPIGKMRPDVPAGLVAVCEKMLEKRPGDRFATVADLISAVSEWGEFDQ